MCLTKSVRRKKGDGAGWQKRTVQQLFCCRNNNVNNSSHVEIPSHVLRVHMRNHLLIA